MNLTNHFTRLTTAAAGLALFIVVGMTSPASAELLLYEPFNYTAGSNLHGSGGSELGFDVASTWSYAGGQTYDILNGSIGFDTYAVGGNKARYNSSGSGINEAASRPIDFAVTGGDLWFSFLTQSNVNSATNVGKGVFLDEGTATGGGADGRDFSLFQKQNASGLATMTYGGQNGSSTAYNDNGVPYLVIGKFSDLGTPGAGAKMWGVTAGEYASLRGDFRVSEAELNATVAAARQATVNTINPTTLVDTGFLNMVSVDFDAVNGLANWTDEIRVGTQLAEVALLATAPTTAVTKISDTFNDLIIPTNLHGDGDGFVQVTNGVNNLGPAFGMVSETGGQAVLQATGSTNNTGIVSINSLQVGATDTVTVFWDIASGANTCCNGIELLIQADETFRGGGDYLGLRFRPGDVLDAYVDNSLISSTAYSTNDALDGFTALLTADADGWQFDFTGLGSLTSLSGGYGSSSFLDLFNGGRIAATVQGDTNGGIMFVNEISAQVTPVVPEPASIVLLAAGVLGCAKLLKNRRSLCPGMDC